MAEKIWIIGASSGIGAALARAYAARGARVIVSARGTERLQALADETDVQALPCDMGSRASIMAAAEAIGGPLDRIVNLAALYDPGMVLDLDPIRAEELLRVNLLGSFHLAQIAPRLLRPGGQLALCGSVAGYFGLPKGQLYSASKAGVINLAESLRAELPDLDIRLISPGFVDTPMTARNDFTMPALLTPDQAARTILHGLDRPGFETHFPRRFTTLLKLLRILPYALGLRLTRRLVT
ncbi:SDR family NAD(P)-dependent oxidoreductase [Sinirhodobacter sp. WL0062]|uniref:SDR family NAD(P)-dependent oxidoreductase n=1 Tax=Rhodobacter flavimaris TaxID=2907145 RepID=A0ABS8YRV2_9RHOB|nr:SDR family NAD(P)-dependent oxidoreductase [Sinirhodobacter sp. WL0062]MCE5972010.1 SDR family NAD(P)-dependent oxidoreductase [Sinirhodobacter sp. WL0062]